MSGPLHFRVEIVRRQIVAGCEHVHGRLLIERQGDWAVCAVFDLYAAEWQTIAALLVAQNIEVIDAPLPTEVPAASD
jgi:hypothetical protein